MGDKINLALIGAGSWGKNLARVFHELGVLRAICDSSQLQHLPKNIIPLQKKPFLRKNMFL